MADSTRQKRVEERILRILSSMFLTEFSEPLNQILINRVEISGDLRIAKVFYSLFQTENRKRAEEKLGKESKRIRFFLAKKLDHLKNVPELIFKYDDGLQNAIKMEELFDKIKKD